MNEAAVDAIRRKIEADEVCRPSSNIIPIC